MTDVSVTTPGWQSPPAPIDEILQALTAPYVWFSPNQDWLVELEQPLLQPIAELAEPEVAVAGFRLNPRTSTLSRRRTYAQMTIRPIATPLSANRRQVIDLPANSRIDYISASPDGKTLAFTLMQADGLELWVMAFQELRPRKLADRLNATYGSPYRWLSNQALLCKVIASDRGAPPTPPAVPPTPIVQENLGRKTPSRTFTNLLQNPHDEALFEYYLTAALEQVTLEGQRTALVAPSLIEDALPSPDGQFIALTTLHRPFSYQLPASRFPRRIEILSRSGERLHQLADLPLADLISTKFDAVRTGPRRVFWRSDRPATLVWVEALDQGDPSQEAAYRDALFTLEPPFTGAPTRLWQCEYRFQRLLWGRGDAALAWEQWYDNRRSRIWRLYPDAPEKPAQLLSERSFQDQYSDPGQPLMAVGPYGRDLLRFSSDGSAVYLSGRGASPQGVYPFLDRLHLPSGDRQRLWQCQDPYYETVVDSLDSEAEVLLTRRQSQTEPPNYFLRSRQDPPQPLTHFPDPAPQFIGMHKELVRYQRADGLPLAAKLYLPPGYQPDRDGRLPMVFWVYPEEFKDRQVAGQQTTAVNTFSRPWGASVLFLLTQGYAVLDNPTLPIVGEAEAEPNDTYVEQLVAGIEAAVDYVVERGIADRDRLGIGGHSYGAFTTANVLAHTRLFRMGIARSGAYNRTLTPFGFQGEQRSFWEAPDTYIEMSPFTHLAKIQAPLLLIHGANDSNAGTYPLQTERLYEALKGMGATVRWVELPLEDHIYSSREAVGHTLWEMVQWCDRYLKAPQ